MKTKYIDIIEQTFTFPQEEFKINSNGLSFYDIPLMDIIAEHGTPLKIWYLPKISQQIQQAKQWFAQAYKAHNYQADYFYSYCTKSSHFSFVLNEALKNDIHIETSSTFDIDIVQRLYKQQKISKNQFIICNGYKLPNYLSKINELVNEGFENTLTVLDNLREFDELDAIVSRPSKLGIRIASEEEPKFEFYTSRLGIGYNDIIPFYQNKVKDNPNFELKMLHFFINTGIKDTAYYWDELRKAVRMYCELKKVCPTLDSLNIGGGFPIKTSLNFDYDYQEMIAEIVSQIKRQCNDAGVKEPHIFTEFGTYTVGESAALLLEICAQKQQNEKERWNMINSSFMVNLPDSWALNQKFVMLAINNWDKDYERVLLGGLTCDSDDYYNSEAHAKAIFLPKYSANQRQYIGFFNTGAYQDAVGGYGGVHHCLIPQPKHLIVEKDENGKLTYRVFSEEQTADEMLKLLGY